MNGLKETLQYVVEMDEPHIIEHEGQKYSDKHLSRIHYKPYADTLTVTTLTGLVDYIKSKVDAMNAHMFIQVVNPTQVKLFSALDEDRNREAIMEVKAQIPQFSFDEYLENERFIIGMQSKFVDYEGDTDKALVLKFAGTVEVGSVAEYGDDGVSQKAAIKNGIATKSDAIVPNPVLLRPFRTFTEVEQPKSSFIFRMKQNKYDGISCAIFEADGGAWKNEAMRNIKNFLTSELSEFLNDITIIA